MSAKAPTITTATIADYSLEIELQVTPQQVWQAITDDIGRWWPGPFFISAGAGPRRFRLEAHPGGRMWEDHGDGNGALWGTVIHVQRDRLLELAGSYARPLSWVGRFELSAISGGTRLRFAEQCFGRVDAAEMASKDQGWRYLFDGCLRAHLEGSEPPAWQD